MRGQTYRAGIPAGLPPGTPIANKTGWIDDHTHDMAIVRPPGEAPFALVVLTRLTGVPTDEGNARIAELARAAWVRPPVSTIGRVEVGAAEPAVAHAVRDRAAPRDHRRDRRGAGDRQRRPGRAWVRRRRSGRSPATSVAGSAACLEGPLRDAVIGPVHRPARDLAADRPRGGRATVRPRRHSTAPCTTWPASPTEHGADRGHAAGGRARRGRGGRPGPRRGRLRRAQAQGRHRPRPPTWPGSAPRARAQARTRPCGSTPTRAGTATRRSASSASSRTPDSDVELVEQPVAGPRPARARPRTPPRRDPGHGRRVGLRPRRPGRGDPSRRGRPGQPQAGQGRRHHARPRAGPGRPAARARGHGRLHARVACRVRAAAGAGHRRGLSTPCPTWTAPGGWPRPAPYADRVAYADGQVVLGRMDT